jgi:PPOX class probable FMN-dependent enzyme
MEEQLPSHPFRDIVTSEAVLRDLIGVPSQIAVAKQVRSLDAHCRRFIAHAPYVLIGTSDTSGRCDVSPKGDAAGFVLVLDDTHLVVPDRPGNKRLDGMRNILSNPNVGLLFLVPGRVETLRVNGRAWLTRDADLLERMAVGHKQPQVGIGVEVHEVFMHCGKASLRSSLWQAERWPDLGALPSAACMLLDHARPDGMTLQQMEDRLSDDQNRLY